MVNPEIVKSKFDSIRKMLMMLEENRKLSLEEFLRQPQCQLATEHELFIAIQSLLDVASHILADRGIRDIADYRDAILKLGREKILPLHFAESIANMAGFRNRLIHEYEDIDPQKIYEFLQNRLDDFDEFMRCVRDHLRLSE